MKDKKKFTCLLAAVNSKYIHSNPAIYALRSSLTAKDRQEQVLLSEYTINQSMDEVRSDIYQKQPDMIGFSCYIWNIRFILDLAADLSKLMPDTRIWLGGPEVSFCAESILKENPAVSGIMCGEGEGPFAALMEHFLDGRALETIAGICYRKDDGAVQSPECDPGQNCLENRAYARLPFPYRKEEIPEHKILYYETSRGCPFACSYCLSSTDRRLRFRDLDLVYEELTMFLEMRLPQVKFLDRTFNADRERACRIWTFLRDHDNGVTNFHFEIEADLLCREDIELLKTMRKGLLQFEIGVQTTNPLTLKEIGRKASTEKILDNVRKIAEGNNIHQHLDLIAGLPYEDYESFARSFSDVYRCRPDQLQMGFLKLLWGTRMEAEREAYGMTATKAPPYEVLQTKWLGYEEMIRLKEIEAALEILYNSRQFEYLLAYLEMKYEDSFRLYETAAGWIRQVRVQGSMPSRKRLYEFLFETISTLFPNDRELIAAILTVDYYAREGQSARPAFCRPVSEWKETEKSFYIREAEERKYLKNYEGYDSRQLQHMTHFEVSDWDIEGLLSKKEIRRSESMLLFDYRERDFRTGNAGITAVQPAEPEKF